MPEFDHGTLVFSRCASCGLLYKSHAAPNFQPDHGYCEYPFRHFDHRVARAARQIRSAQRFVEARSVLDIGCNHGYALAAGQQLGLRATGVDVDADAVNACRARGLDARVGSAEALPVPDQSFDIVILRHLLGHLRHPRLALSEARRVLAPGGILVLAVHDLDYLRVRLAGPEHKFFLPTRAGPEHHLYFRTDTLERMLADCGFSVRTRSKALLLAPRSWREALYEPLRFMGMWLWQTFARLTHLRRELFYMAAR